MADELTESALRYHRIPRPGKIEVVPTKPLATQRDLSLAYSPGVAAACNEIVRDPATAAELTARANLVAVVTNGTAVLGLGAIGPLAAKPVMEGKGVLFKKFAGIDVFDIELAETDQEKLVDIVAALEPTFGGINLEDIKAPECFYVEQKLRERLSIPVFHDDQHGTAIIVGAAVQNGLALVGKDIAKVKLVVSGAGAAALSCLGLLEKLGLPKENIWVTDIKGVVWKGRNELMDPWKERYARETPARSLAEVIERRRHLPRPVGRRRAQEGDGRQDGGQAADPGARQSRSGDHAGGRRRRARRCHRRHRPQRLSQPGEQRPLLPLHLPRRARCRRQDGQRRDEDRLRARARLAGAQGAVRGRGARLRRAGRRRLRRQPDHSQAVRPAADRRAGPGRRARPPWTRAWRRGRSPTSRPTASSSTSSSSSPAWSCGRCSSRRGRTPSG